MIQILKAFYSSYNLLRVRDLFDRTDTSANPLTSSSRQWILKDLGIDSDNLFPA